MLRYFLGLFLNYITLILGEKVISYLIVWLGMQLMFLALLFRWSLFLQTFFLKLFFNVFQAKLANIS